VQIWTQLLMSKSQKKSLKSNPVVPFYKPFCDILLVCNKEVFAYFWGL
jgi:hypothetical protein